MTTWKGRAMKIEHGVLMMSQKGNPNSWDFGRGENPAVAIAAIDSFVVYTDDILVVRGYQGTFKITGEPLSEEFTMTPYKPGVVRLADDGEKLIMNIIEAMKRSKETGEKFRRAAWAAGEFGDRYLTAKVWFDDRNFVPPWDLFSVDLLAEDWEPVLEPIRKVPIEYVPEHPNQGRNTPVYLIGWGEAEPKPDIVIVKEADAC